jgi:hypothetical protein
MSNYSTNIPSSFVNLNPELFLSDRDCAIVKQFCIPIYDRNDLKFQIKTDFTFVIGTPLPNEALITLFDTNGDQIAFVTGTTITSYFEGDGVYFIHYNFATSNLMNSWEVGQCLHINIQVPKDTIEPRTEYIDLGTSSQCFQRIPDKCYSSKLTYYNNENAFSFYYPSSTWANVIRLPLYFRNPQVKNDQDVYVRSDGTRTKLFARLSKQYQGLVDNVTEEVHQKLVVALSHDNVTFVTDNDYELECTFENEYNNNYPEILMGVNVWTADFLVMETPFDEQNNNCA